MRVRTGYSFKTAFGHLPEVMAAIVASGLPAAPISDRMSTWGFNRWTKLALKAGLRPIYGVEIPCVTSLGERKPVTDMWTFFAKDDLRALHDLIAIASDNPGREPSLLYKQALAAPGVFVIAGERLNVEAAREAAGAQFYVALSPSTPKGLIARVRASRLRLLASGDNYYPTPDDLETYRVALGRRSGTQTYPRHIMNDGELTDVLQQTGLAPDLIAEAFANRNEVMDLCQATMRQAKMLVPEKLKTLRQMCVDGAARTGTDLSDPVYSARLDRELALIAEKDYEDYFYIITDLVTWAKKRMIVGPARGSSCGSLVCYLLDITTVDPIPYGLIFERFIDINRMDLPDIDIDFSDVHRHKVFEYAEERFGRERVARLGTVGMFQAKSALKQAGAVLRIPQWRTDKLTDSIIIRTSGDARAGKALEDTLIETDVGRAIVREYPEIMIANRLEAHPVASSQHAAGLILTNDPVRNFAAVDPRTGACWVDKKDAEALNMLKVDALGLTQLSIFERTLELLGKPPVSGYLETLPLNDPAAYALLNAGKFSGIFQFTGTAMRVLAGQSRFERIDDIIAMTAIARPGPMSSGGAMAWIRRRTGLETGWAAAGDVHPLLAELTEDTFGVIIYQETVMRITREIGKFSWEDTSRIRKLMSAIMGAEYFASFWEQFRTGALENGLTELQAKSIWDQINTFGSWAFNKSHAVAYGLVSYYCAWLKAHHPIEFAAATLDAEPDPGKQVAILRELAAEGVEYTPIDPDHSTDRWTLAEGRLIGPLMAVKGIGPGKVREILDARKRGSELRPALRKQLEAAKTDIDSLFPVADAIRRNHPDLAAINIFSEPTEVIKVQPGVRGEVMIFVVVTKVMPKHDNDDSMLKKRGGKRLTGPDQSLNLFVRDDTDEMFCKIGRFDYERIGRAVKDQAMAGKSLFAIKGTCPPDYRMIKVNAIRYLGTLQP